MRLPLPVRLSVRARRFLPAVISLATASATLLAVTGPAEAGRGADAGSRAGCAQPVLSESAPARDVARSDAAAFRAAAVRNGKSRAELRAQARDKTFWLDRCGQGFFVEPQATAAQKARSNREAAAPA